MVDSKNPPSRSSPRKDFQSNEPEPVLSEHDVLDSMPGEHDEPVSMLGYDEQDSVPETNSSYASQAPLSTKREMSAEIFGFSPQPTLWTKVI